MSDTKEIGIFGCTGLLGSMCVKYLSKNPNFRLRLYGRDAEKMYELYKKYSNIEGYYYHVDYFGNKGYHIDKLDYVINCAGKTKGQIDENNSDSIKEAIEINSLLPFKLSQACKTSKCRVINPLSDCEFSGSRSVELPGYNENDKMDVGDVYGISKHLGGLCKNDNIKNLRVSIIGPEMFGRSRSLLGWFLSQPQNAELTGYANHFWNGITSLEYAKIIERIIENDLFDEIPNVQNIVPNSSVSKHRLLAFFGYCYGRGDLTINEKNAATSVNRILSTVNPDMNRAIWGGDIKSIVQMVKEMAEFE